MKRQAIFIVILVAALSYFYWARLQNARSQNQIARSLGIQLPQTNAPEQTLAEARRHFQTKLTRRDSEDSPPDDPPAGMFRLVSYPSPAGSLAAYVSPDPGDGKTHPAIIWIVGGFSSSISGVAWRDFPAKNDQSASAFRKAGIMMMYPSLRGGNQNPGVKEGFYGEVDDVLAAADFLAKQPGVDPNRIYLGGHSTGGTLALLTAECSSRFRAVFAFGPVATVASYGQKNLPFDINNMQEVTLRSPGLWLASIRSPVFILAGKDAPSNAKSVQWMAEHAHRGVQFHLVSGANHFSILAPVTKLIARRIMQDDGPSTNIAFQDAELNGLFSQ